MSTFWQRTHEGCLMVDHRASPGLPKEMVERLGYGREGSVAELKTLGCRHCNATVVVNPLRTRERVHCFKCNRYICDLCAADMQRSDYDHRPFEQIVDMVGSGKYVCVGSFQNPTLIATGK